MHKLIVVSLLATASAIGTATAAQAQVGAPASPTGPDAQAASPDEGLADIVVTAQRREENLQKVPVAVTAVTAAQLTDLRVTNIRNLSVLAPGLQINTQGRQTVPTVNIRGISSGSTIVAVDPKVGIYVDGVYVGRVVGSVFDLADIERVEVLRGPQGTLFGRNATGGAISITSAIPTGEFGVRGTVSYGNYDAKRAKVSINLPQFGPFKVSLSYLHDDIRGDVRNLIGGQVLDVSNAVPGFGRIKAANRLGGRNVDGVMAAVRAEFGAVQADYRFDYSDAASVGRYQQSYGTLRGPNDALGAVVDAIIGFQGLNGGITNRSPTNEALNAVANFNSIDRIKTQGHSLTLKVDASDQVTLKSITAYRKFHQIPSAFDLSASGGLLFTRAQLGALFAGNVPGIIAAPRPGPLDKQFTLFNVVENRQEQFSQELQIAVSTDEIDMIGGVFYFHERNPTTNLLSNLGQFSNGVFAPFLTTPAGAVTRLKTDNDSYAAYAQATLHLGEMFDLTGGIRHSIDDRGTYITSLSGVQAGSIGVGNFKASYGRTTYTGIATFKPTDRITAYAKYATGYTTGGIYAGSTFLPEDLTSYELGLKTQLFDNHVRANFAIYQNDYKDLQTQVFTTFSIIANAGKARIKGAEAEIEVVPFRGLTLSANGAYTDFKYKEYRLSIGGPDVSDIAAPPFVSKYTARFSLGYRGPEFDNGAHGVFRIDAAYRSKIRLGPLAVLNADRTVSPIDRFNTAKGFWLVDGRVGVADFPLGGGQVSLTAFGSNLLDEKYTLYGVNVFQLVRGNERGRTYGVELGFNF